ncbi:thermostable hemolysin [Halomonas sp. C05BenzN]|uniref:thermostable hemolysin n=1 Tax=Halomonas sp. C05BenzN TaxID=3411041 RepID=UPI003B946170
MPDPRRLPCLQAAATPPTLHWQEALHWTERRRLAHLIRRRFAEEHGAAINQLLPRLFGLWQGDWPQAAVGVRSAACGPLFQERYLDVCAERLLAERFARPVARHQVAEIGNLASRRPGLQRPLFLHLVDQLGREGIGWLLFTATPEVANGIRRLGLTLEPVMVADPTRLGEDRARWGRYYERHPWVMAGDLRRAHRELRERGLLPVPLPRPAEVAHAHLA